MTGLALQGELALLFRFVVASGWQTTGNGLMQAVPHLTERFNADDCISTLRNLGLGLNFVTGSTRELHASDLPALRIGHHGDVSIVLALRNDTIRVESATGAARWEPVSRDTVTFVRIKEAGGDRAKTALGGVGSLVRQFRSTWMALFLASLVTNVMALAVPVLIMVIYDRAIPTGATELLVALGIAMGIVLSTDFLLRSIRARAVAHMGAAMEARLSLGLFRKLSAVSLDELRKSDVDQQIARLKQFEGMRELFSGPVFATLLDIPFIFLFLGMLFMISPAIGTTILLACIVFALAAWVSAAPLARRNQSASAARTAHQKLLFEMIQMQRSLQRLGVRDLWADRHRHLAAESAAATGRARRLQLSCQAFGQSVMAISGVCAVFLGTELAMTGALSFGALVAVMSLVWKCLAPVNALYSNLPQIQGFVKSSRQIDRLLGLKEEFTRGAALSDFKAFRGGISMANMSFRFPGSADPLLSGLTLDISPGECVVIAGPNGSGKSLLLDLIDGLYAPVGGTLKFDGVDMRQIAVDDLRHMISYARQLPEFFHGTIWQNFQLACPDLTRSAAEAAIAQIGLADDLSHFPEGLDTRLSEAFRKTLSASSLRGLTLARCLCRPAAIYLFDDPSNGLDARRAAAFTATLAKLKGDSTTVLVSSHPDHIALADRIIWIEQGRVVLNDTGDGARRKYDAMRARRKVDQ
ncbi:hypothetical protein DKT77_04650 [Meridianimarinicoccus roseus]|uniref:ATP-binding cassette domain-containing protein n=1 Tax=Meridianimarinicoccus roseus TaxID=2072018 RepID=A0A2V2LFN3_9RHOB|nr:ATP-binding cassette domain-containing protein [Meridianimarinicoccus roseus]PWR03802.1 hypothetical protein DKT77_04650 [Meridianimarinicoccus roseus]